MNDFCAVVPVYNHGRTVGRVVGALRRAGLACFVVDDGSGGDCAAVLDALAAADPAVTLLRHAANRGKGAALRTGLCAAAARGHTHALQIDADGQHDLADIPRLVADSAAHPDALVCGEPSFDASAPRSRVYGRRLTNFWVAIHTWSLGMPDAMCGFRVYPLAATVAVLGRHRVAERMAFDIEILVRLCWRGVQARRVATRVSYPADGASHFRMRLDNALITRTHTILFFGMLARAPRLAARKLRPAGSRWSPA